VIRPAVCSFLAALYLCTPAHTQGPARQDDTTIKVNVRLVRMLVTVKDAAGQLIGSLNKSDFTVFDNGVKQDIAVFDRETEQPLSVAMMVDTSASTGIELHYDRAISARTSPMKPESVRTVWRPISAIIFTAMGS